VMSVLVLGARSAEPEKAQTRQALPQKLHPPAPAAWSREAADPESKRHAQTATRTESAQAPAAFRLVAAADLQAQTPAIRRPQRHAADSSSTDRSGKAANATL